MAKGKFGLSLAAVAVIAFGFCALRQPQSVLLVAGFALLAEKDEWLNRQVVQALLLTIAYLAELVMAGYAAPGLAGRMDGSVCGRRQVRWARSRGILHLH